MEQFAGSLAAPTSTARVGGIYRRANQVLITLCLTTLPIWWLAISGQVGPGLGIVRWLALFAPPALAMVLLLSTTYFACRGAGPRNGLESPGVLLTLSGGVFLGMLIVLALPPLIVSRLPHPVVKVLEAKPTSLEVLKRRALMHPDPVLRQGAAWEAFLMTGETVQFVNAGGQRGVFSPTREDRTRFTVYRWLAARPGAAHRERRTLALVDLTLIMVALAGLPVAVWAGRMHQEFYPPEQRPPAMLSGDSPEGG